MARGQYQTRTIWKIVRTYYLAGHGQQLRKHNYMDYLYMEKRFGPAGKDPCRKEFSDYSNKDGATSFTGSGRDTEKRQEACCYWH